MPRDYRNAGARKRGGQRESRSRRHVWYARIVIAAIIAAFLASFIWLRPVLLPFIIALIIVFVLEPGVTRMQRWGIPRALGVVISYLLFFGSVVLFFYYLVPKLEHESKRLVAKLQIAVQESPRFIKQFEHGVEDILGRITPDDGALPPPPPPGMRWGRGPHVDGIQEVDVAGDVPFLPPARFTAEERVASALTGTAEGDGGRRASEERERSNLILTQIGDGEWGVKFNESNVEFETLGEGKYNFSTRAGRLTGSQAANLREQVMGALRQGLEELGGAIIGGVVGLIEGLVKGIFGGMIAALVTFMVGAFILIDADKFKRFVRNRVPARYRPDYDDLITRLNDGLSGVVRGQLLICLVNGILSFVGFLIFIPEYAIVMAILAGVMSLIPIFGTIISTIPAVLIGLTVGMGTAVAVLAWILGIHFVEANILNPKIVGAQAEIHPALVMFVIIAGETMFGIKGALLAVPVASIIQSVVIFTYGRAERVIMRGAR